MAKKICIFCLTEKEEYKFYKTPAGGRYNVCKKCYNFRNSKRFLDWLQFKKKSLQSPKEYETAERIARRIRVKKMLRERM